MKGWLALIPLLILLCLTIIYKNDIAIFLVQKIVYSQESHVNNPNDYALNYQFDYVKETDNFIANDKQELINILYTFLNNGEDKFYFYCNYDTCLEDVNFLTDSNQLANLNNFVHPYNNYRQATVTSNAFNKIEVIIEKSYSDEVIKAIDKKIDEIISKILTDDMNDKEKITAIHNYIIETTDYDTEYVEANLEDIDSPSHKAIGPLYYHKALCGGYTDAMALFLNKLKIPNYRISSENHIWNYVYLDNNWYHIDLTWDDPVTDDGSHLILDNFLLITTEQLENYHTGYHNYNKSIYIEAK